MKYKQKLTRPPSSLSTNSTLVQSADTDTILSVSSRQRQSKRDEAIRKKLEQELSKKKAGSTRIRQTKKIAGTVSALRPAQALTVRDSILVIEAAQLMAAKRGDCVLVVDDEEHLSGIFTAKDLAYRVVADNLDARSITVADIMTRNPMCVTADTSAQDALNLMVSKGFRHLPVCNEEGDIFGLLDITKCIYEALHKMEKAYGSSRKLYDALEGVEREWANSPVQLVQYMEALKDKMSCPDLTTVLDQAGPVQVSVRAQVREVAKLMKEHHTTAVLVMDHGGLAGIFTSKDIVLRVIAAGLAPDSCSVVRVMTPHPDTALPSTSILDALKKMHDGHYLNLPVLDEERNIIGLIDVLRLTYATLEQINSIEGNQSDGVGTGGTGTGSGSGGGMSKFWNSITATDQAENESVLSDSLSPHYQRKSSHTELTPADSASVVQEDHQSMVSLNDSQFSFKFNYGNKTHRFRHDIQDFKGLLKVIEQKIMTEHLNISQSYVAIGPEEDRLTISYLDDENDQVIMTSNSDLNDAVQLAKKAGLDKVRLFIQDSFTLENQMMNDIPASKPTALEVVIEEEMSTLDDDNIEQEDPIVEKDKKDYAKEYNIPIPQDMLLPAAITFLGVVILGVFTISKITGQSRY